MLPKSTQEQRAPFYQDIESLLSPGFLSHSARIGLTSIKIRSLGPGDQFLLRTRTEGVNYYEWMVWAVASSIWMVDGYNVLGERHFAPRMARTLRSLPRSSLEALFTLVLGLFGRAEAAQGGVEAYSYEAKSRSFWKLLGGAHGLKDAGGVEGGAYLGTNNVQRIWLAFNEAEDRQMEQNWQWAGFKMLASVQAPKGVEKMDAKDKQIRAEEEERRQSVQDRYYYYRRGVIDREGFRQGQKVHGLQVTAKSAEDLQDEYKRWVTGDMDEHDRIVAAYKQQALDRQRQVEEDRHRHLERVRAEADAREAAALSAAPMVGYTADQLARILEGRDEGLPSGARKIYNQSRAAQVVNKHIQSQQVVDPRLAGEAPGISPLQQQLQGRMGGPARPAHISQEEWEDYQGQIDPRVFGGPVRR